VSVLKTDDFVTDVERQFEWYTTNAGREVADRYLDAVEATCRMLGEHPLLGPRGGFTHPRLRDWRFFLVLRPFQKHILFYEVAARDVVMRRAVRGGRDLSPGLLEPLAQE
jgi:plasmid stabilization system protein ParE